MDFLENIGDGACESVLSVVKMWKRVVSEVCAADSSGNVRYRSESMIEDVVQLEDHTGSRRDVEAKSCSALVQIEVGQGAIAANGLKAREGHEVSALIELFPRAEEAPEELVAARDVESILPGRGLRD